MTVAWNLVRLQTAAPQLAHAVRRVQPQLPADAPLSPDIIEAAQAHLPRQALERPFAAQLVKRLRLQPTSTSVSALLAGSDAAYAKHLRTPILAWSKGATSIESPMFASDTTTNVRPRADGTVWTITRGGAVSQWATDGTRMFDRVLGWALVPMLEVLADGRLATVQNDLVKVWSAEGENAAVESRCKHDRAVRDIAALPNGGFVTTADDGYLRSWDADNALTASARTPSFRVRPAVWNTKVATVGDGYSIVIYDTPELTASKTIPAVTTTGLKHLTFLVNGTLVAATTDGVLRSWLPDGSPVATVDAHNREILAMFALGDDHVVTVDERGAHIWNDAFEKVTSLCPSDHIVSNGAALADGRILTVGTMAGTTRIWSPA